MKNYLTKVRLTLKNGYGIIIAIATIILTFQNCNQQNLSSLEETAKYTNLRSSTDVIQKIPALEREILIEFYNSTNGDKWVGLEKDKKVWKTIDGEFSQNECQWTGIRCSEGIEAHVIGINVANNDSNSYSAGTIPPSLGKLEFLERLDIVNSNVGGTIPPELGNLKKLKRLNLGALKLTGEIPRELGNLQELVFLSLYANKLTGTIPAELGGLIKLEFLGIGANELSGGIPRAFSNLKSLKILDLSNSKFSCQILSEIGELALPNLDYLTLSNNALADNSSNGAICRIPDIITNLKALNYLELKNCQLQGPISDELVEMSKTNNKTNNKSEPMLRIDIRNNCFSAEDAYRLQAKWTDRGDQSSACAGSNAGSISTTPVNPVTNPSQPVVPSVGTQQPPTKAIPYLLTVIEIGTGTASGSVSGRITNSTSGANFHTGMPTGYASFSYNRGSSVTLGAYVAKDYATFAGWEGGGCSGKGDCVVSMDSAKTIKAKFDKITNPVMYKLTLTKSGTGLGSVTWLGTTISPAFTCSTGCTKFEKSYKSRVLITLTAKASEGSTFIGWEGGPCIGGNTSSLSCTVGMDAAKLVIAKFNKK